MNNVILRVRDLKTYFTTSDGTLKAVNGISFDLSKGQTLGIIGESGCGKSVASHSILGIVDPPGKIEGGEIWYRASDGTERDLVRTAGDKRAMRAIRGKEISMIFQEPMACLAPVYSIGEQMTEALRVHDKTLDRKRAREICAQVLRKAGMPNPEQRLDDYPHQLSGGMCQRAMIAMALLNSPSLLIADEPTTALDVTVQAQITELLKSLQRELSMSMIYITHDIGVIAEVADVIAVMYLGKIVETAERAELLKNPLHPYTRGLLKSAPRLGGKSRRLDTIAGSVPIPIKLPEQCGFCVRCPHASERCGGAVPEPVEASPGHRVSCFLYGEGARRDG